MFCTPYASNLPTSSFDIGDRLSLGMSGRGQAGQSCCIDQITCSPPLAPPPLSALPDNSRIFELCGVMRETKSPSKRKSREYNVLFPCKYLNYNWSGRYLYGNLCVFVYVIYSVCLGKQQAFCTSEGKWWLLSSIHHHPQQTWGEQPEVWHHPPPRSPAACFPSSE